MTYIFYLINTCLILFSKNKNLLSKKKRHNYKQCKARCWGGKKYVKYNPIKKKWTYGFQCTRNSMPNSDFCLTHHKLSLKTNGLPHGLFNQKVPHYHYYKYKKKIETRFKIK